MQGYFKNDCSGFGKILEFNKELLSREKQFDYQYFQLPKMSALANGNNVEISIEAQYESNSFPEYLASAPSLLLLKVGSNSSHNLVGNKLEDNLSKL